MGMKLADLFVRIGADISGFSRGLQKAQKSLATVGADMQRAGMAMSLAITVPMVAAAAAGLKLAGDFEAGMNKVAAVSGATGAEFEALEKQARDLGKTTKFTAGEAADAMGFLAMAGMETTDIMGSMTDTLNLAAAANIGLAESADVITNILKGYGLEVEDLAAATDTLATIMSSANTDLTQLGTAFKFVGPVAAGVGLRFNEMAAAIGLLGNAGIQGSMAGTSLRKIITSLLGPSKEGANIMKKYGINVLDAAGNMLPMAAITEQFAAGFEKVGSSAEHSADMMELIGLRGGPAMISIIDQGADAMRNLEEKADKAAGSVGRMAETMMKGLKGSMTKMRSALQDAGISLGQILAPHMERLVKLTTKLANKFSELATKFKELPAPIQATALAFAAFVTALGPVLMVTGILLQQVASFKLLVPALAKVGGGFTKFGGVLAKLAMTIKGIGFAAMWASIKAGVVAVISTLTALSGGTLAIVIAAIVALGAALFVVIKHWHNVKDVIESFGRDLARMFLKVVGVIADFGKNVAQVFTAIGNWIVKWVVRIFGQEFFDRIKKIWGGIVNFFKSAWAKITKFFEGGFGKIVAMAGNLARKLGLEETADAFARWKLELDLAAEGAHDFIGPLVHMGPLAQDVVKQVKLLPFAIHEATEEATEFARAMFEAGTETERVLDEIPKTFDELIEAVKKAERKLLPFWQSASDMAEGHRQAVEEQLKVYDKLGVTAGPAIDALRRELVRLDGVMAQITQHSLDDEFKALQVAVQSGVVKSIKELSTELEVAGGLLDTLAQESLTAVTEGMVAADKAMKAYGVTSVHEIEKMIAAHEDNREAILKTWEDGTDSAGDYWRVVIKSLEKQIDLTRQLGHDTKGLEKELDAAGDALKETGVGWDKVSKKAGEAGFVMKQVSTIVTDLSKGIADAILEGKNFGEVVVNVFEQAGKAVLRFAIETIAKTLMNSLLNAQGAVAGLSKAFDGLMKGIDKLVGGGAAGAAGGGGGAMGALAMGPLGMLGTLGTMVSSIIGNFQNAKMEKTMNAIEENTRFIKIWTGEQEFSIRNNTAKTREGIGYLNASADTIKTTLREIAETLNNGIFVQDSELEKTVREAKEEAKVTAEVATSEMTDVTKEVVAATNTVAEATYQTQRSIDTQTDHIDYGFDELKSVQERGAEILQELGSNVDNWGSVMDEVASGMITVANAVSTQTRSLNALMGGGNITPTTHLPDAAIQAKQLYYLRFLENLDVPLSNALAFMERSLVSVGQQFSQFEPLDKKNVDEYESLQKELVTLQKKERKTQKEQLRILEIEDKLLKLEARNLDNREDLRNDEVTSANQYGRDLGTAATAVTSGSNRLRQAGTAAGVAINDSFGSVTKAVQAGVSKLASGAVATVGKITSVYAGGLQDVARSPFVPAPPGGGGGQQAGITNTGIWGMNAAPQFYTKPPQVVNLFVDVNNADAKKVADEMVGTWRSAGVDI